jgi:hypothetical protein
MYTVDDSLRNNNIFYNNDEISLELKDIIFESIISNTDVMLEIDEDTCKYAPKG